MSTVYTPDELEAFAKIIKSKKPPTPSRESHSTAPRVLKFASYGDAWGMVFRFKMEDGTVRNLQFNALVAAYLAAAIVDVAERVAWSLDGETLHPDAISHGLTNPDPDAERRWQKEWSKTKVVPPDENTRAQCSNAVSINGEGSLDAFVMALALDSGQTIHLRMSPLVAWELSGAVHDVGEEHDWWNDLQTILPGRTIN